jgi:hypothetical protein
MIEPSRGFPSPGAIERIGINTSHANPTEGAAALSAALCEIDKIHTAQIKWRHDDGGSGGVMDNATEAEVASAMGALPPVQPALPLAADDDAMLELLIAAEPPPTRDVLQKHVRELICAVNSGGICSKEALSFIIESLPEKFKSAISRALLARNSRITDHNVVLTALRGCNTAVYVLSSGVAASVATFYVLEYITKDPTARASTLSIALDAQEKVQKVRGLRVGLRDPLHT